MNVIIIIRKIQKIKKKRDKKDNSYLGLVFLQEKIISLRYKVLFLFLPSIRIINSNPRVNKINEQIICFSIHFDIEVNVADKFKT